MPMVFNGTTITGVFFNGTSVNTVFFNGTTTVFSATVQTSLPTIGSMSCICDSNGTAIIVTVTNNDSSSATVNVAEFSSFSGQQSAFVSSGGSATFYFYGYFNPPGSVTFYARAQASGKTMSNTRTRTQNLTFCFSEPGCGGGGGFGGF
jgi:hypothetical protein